MARIAGSRRVFGGRPPPSASLLAQIRSEEARVPAAPRRRGPQAPDASPAAGPLPLPLRSPRSGARRLGFPRHRGGEDKSQRGAAGDGGDWRCHWEESTRNFFF